ncbi:MAG: cyclase family protein [Anaerolineales bacterium]|nr:cyclase family protein [Anaerolineales bacterium]
MHVYDISVGIEPGMPVWPGDLPLELIRVSAIADGANANVSRISCSVHIGTHMDAPLHFVEGGASIEALPLKVLIGRAYVVNLPKADVIDAAALEGANIPPRTKRVLFKTRNSALWARGETRFQTDFVAVDESGAHWLVRKGVQLVGVDYLSVAPYKRSKEVHETLLKAGVVIVEGVDLSRVAQGRYTLYCLPLKLVGSDGAPTRAILLGV